MDVRRALLPGLAALAWAGSARAAPATRLVYSRESGAEQCADEDALRSAVAARLGYDPFFPWAKTTLVANVRQDAKVYRAHIALLDAQGLVRGTRDLADAHADCAELLSAMALGISIALDMLDPRPPEPEPQPEPPRQEPPPARPPPAAPERDVPENTSPAPPPQPPLRPGPAAGRMASDTRIEAGLDVRTGVGALPAPHAGADAFARARGGWWSLGLEGAFAAASRRARFGTEASAYAVDGLLVPCAHLASMGVCALASLGVVRASAASTGTAAVLAFGLRITTEVPVSANLSMRLHGEAVAPLARTTLRVDGEDLWTAPAMAAHFGLGFVYRF